MHWTPRIPAVRSLIGRVPSGGARCGALLLAALLPLTGCGNGGSAEASGAATVTPSASPAQEGDGEPLATISGQPIHVDDLDELIGNDLATLDFQYRSQRYQMLDAALSQVVRDRLLDLEAEARGTTREQLVESLTEGKLEVSEAEVESWYAQNAQRLQGRPLDPLRPAIRQFLVDQRRDAILDEEAERLGEEHGTEILLEPFRVDVEAADAPAYGPADAPVTLVEFSDFECPYCGGFIDTLERIKGDYEGRIRLVYRQFPLREIHPNAQKAAEASLCAAEQDGFWPLHDLMFEEQSSLAVADLREKAERIGLDVGAFSACLDSGKYAEQVETDMRAGARVGVTGTPAVFVNGRPVVGGAVPYERLAEIIDDELERIERQP